MLGAQSGHRKGCRPTLTPYNFLGWREEWTYQHLHTTIPITDPGTVAVFLNLPALGKPLVIWAPEHPLQKGEADNGSRDLAGHRGTRPLPRLQGCTD